MQFTSVADAEKWLKEEEQIHKQLLTLIQHAISKKNTGFSKTEFANEYTELSIKEFLYRESDNSFMLDFGSLPVALVLVEFAEEMMQEKVPSRIVDSLSFARRFCEKIRQPKLNLFWYSDLEIQLESFLLICLNQKQDVDVTTYMRNLTEETRQDNPDLTGMDISYRHVFAFLTDEIEKSFEVIAAMLASNRTQQAGWDALQDIGRVNTEKAKRLFIYAKEHNGENYDGFLPNLILGLFVDDRSCYLQESFELHKINPVQGLLTLTWIKYDEPEQITAAFDFIKSNAVDDIEYQRNLGTFYARIIENIHAPETLRQECFSIIGDLTSHNDDALRNNLIWRTAMIKGYDEEKYELLPRFMAWGQPWMIRDYFNYFNSPSSLFDLIRKSFLYHGMNVDMGLLRDPLHSQFMLNRKAFEKELANLLVEDIAILRFAGIQVLNSAHNGVYSADFSDMDEKQQERAIDSLLLLPINIEEIVPIVVGFKSSVFPVVRQKLQTALTDLIPAYENHLIKMVSNCLNETVENDQQLLHALQQAYAKYEEELGRKRLLNEFDPLQNELSSIELFYRLEQEQQAERLEKAQAQSFFRQIARQINVIRGNGYSVEGKDEIMTMQKFGMSRLIDRRYYINPDKFEWNLKINAIAKNYKP